MFKKRGAPKEYFGFLAHYKLLIAVCTLIGTIVGAGILGIPYVVSKIGFFYGAIIIVLLGIALLFLNLAFGEVILRTKGQHQLTGYAEKYLGSKGKFVMLLTVLLSIYGALTAYLIGEGESFFALLGFGSPLLYTIIFFVVMTIIISRGLKVTGRAEFFLVALLVIVIILTGIFSYEKLNVAHLQGANITPFFLAYGVIFFALKGLPAIPELREELGRERKKLKQAIIIGSLIPIVLYILFAIVVMGTVGLEQFEALEPNQRIATIALSFYSSPPLAFLVNVLAILTLFTSYVALGTALLQVYMYDYGLSRYAALLLTSFPPLLIVLLGLTTFMGVLSFTGVLAGGMEGIMVILMYWKAARHSERKPEYSLSLPRAFLVILFLLLLTGIVHELFL